MNESLYASKRADRLHSMLAKEPISDRMAEVRIAEELFHAANILMKEEPTSPDTVMKGAKMLCDIIMGIAQQAR